MRREIRLHRNIATNKLEIRFIEIDRNGDLFSLLPDGSTMPVQPGVVIPICLSLPIETEIKIDEKDTSEKRLLDQKHSDKESHIQNLNEIILELIRK